MPTDLLRRLVGLFRLTVTWQPRRMANNKYRINDMNVCIIRWRTSRGRNGTDVRRQLVFLNRFRRHPLHTGVTEEDLPSRVMHILGMKGLAMHLRNRGMQDASAEAKMATNKGYIILV